MNLKLISEYRFVKMLNKIDNKRPHQFKGKLSPNLLSDLKFSVYGDSIIHLFDPTNTDQLVDQYYIMEV